MSRHIKHVLHGKSKTKEYKIWMHMVQRCADPNRIYYGGKGITVCEKWKDVRGFLEDMGSCPEGFSLERIDNSKGYLLENCRWIPKSEQANNRSTTHNIEYNGETLTITNWGRRLGVTDIAIRTRLKKGQTFSEIFKHYTSDLFKNSAWSKRYAH